MSDIKAYRLFLLSIQMGSISCAADSIYIDRAAANRKLKQLEHYLGGKKLLILTNKGCELTGHGRLIIKEAQQIVDRDERLKLKLKGLDKDVLKIASTHSLISSYISYTLPEFLKKNNNISIELIAIDNYQDFVHKSYDIGLFGRTAYKTSLIQEKFIYKHPSTLCKSGLYQKKWSDKKVRRS